MKKIAAVPLLTLLVCLAQAAGDGSAVWKARAQAAEFCLIEEEGRFNAESWAVLPAEEQARELADARAGGRAEGRQTQVRAYYSEMTRKWSLEDVSLKYGLLEAGGIRAVRIWQGTEHAAYLERKRAGLAALRNASSAAPLTEEAVRVSAQYLDAGAVSQLKSVLLAGGVSPRFDEKKQKRQAEFSGRLDGVKGAYKAAAASGNGGKFFDGSRQSGESAAGPEPESSKGAGLDLGTVSANYRQSHASTIPGGAVPALAGGAAPAPGRTGFTQGDLQRIDTVVAEMKLKRQAAGSENGWLGNFRQSVGLAKADSGCSGWSSATIDAIKNDPALSQKYEVGYVRGLRNPLGAVTKWPPSVPLPLPHFVAVVWPKGTDPNDTAIYVDAWAKDTKRGPIREYTYEYSFDVQDLTPTVYYDRPEKKEIRLPRGGTMTENVTVVGKIRLLKANPWVY